MSWNSTRYSALLGRVIVGAGLVAVSVLAATASSALAVPPGSRPAVRPGLVNAPGDLRSVTCTSPSKCWAVGEMGNPAMGQSQVLRFNGVNWSPVDLPQSGATGPGAFSELNSVRCLTADDCWAVGSSRAPRMAENNLALHWNGQRWRIVNAPDPGGISSGSFSNLNDISCTSGKNCLAVGDDGELSPLAGNPPLKHVTEALRWNGMKWSLVKAPNPAGTGKNVVNVLSAIRCTSSRICWAAGNFGSVAVGDTHFSNLLLRWNGQNWKTAPVPNPGGTGTGSDNEIAALACVSASDCWAAGTFGQVSDVGRTKALDQVLHFNGRSWSKVKVPNPDGTANGNLNLLNGITCSGASSCFAVGQFGGDNSGATQAANSALRWNGKKWQKVGTPNPGATSNDLFGVKCTSASRCFAVGGAFTAGTPNFDELLQWNGQKWVVA